MNNKTQEKTAFDLWKELRVSHANFEFSCGGDSMNDTNLIIYSEDGSEITCGEIADYIDNEIYNVVEFYVNSDGHYMGEAGNVHIVLSEDGEEFEYSKSSRSEWSETITSPLEVELDEKTIQFIKEKVLNINGEEGSGTINYKIDCILTDEEEEIGNKLVENINIACRDFSPEDYEINDTWFRFTTNDVNDIISIEGNILSVEITQQYYEYRDEQ